MKRGIITALILLVASTAVWGQAEFSEISGKVEVRPASGGSWIPAEVGMQLARNTMISTGFNASAEIQVAGSTVEVESLTRMEFEEIVERSDAVETRLNLNVGRMRAQVRSTDGRSQDFQVRSPISTAAVRGTDFSFDGEELQVSEGAVAFVNNYGQQRAVSAGQRSQTTGEPGSPSNPADEANQNSSTDTDPIGAGSDDEDTTGAGGIVTVPPGPRATRGSVVIEIQ
ncbi:MAG: FecR domain-containing protein [Alkalispirochaeta sp.]